MYHWELKAKDAGKAHHDDGGGVNFFKKKLKGKLEDQHYMIECESTPSSVAKGDELNQIKNYFITTSNRNLNLMIFLYPVVNEDFVYDDTMTEEIRSMKKKKMETHEQDLLDKIAKQRGLEPNWPNRQLNATIIVVKAKNHELPDYT